MATDILKLVHILGVVFMSAPLYSLILVNERALLGPSMVYSVDRYVENLIKKTAVRCYVFQTTVLVTGIALVYLYGMGLVSILTDWVLAAKTGLLLMLMGLLSYVHFGIQPKVEALLAKVEGDPIPEEIASAIRPLRIRRKKLAAICLFIVIFIIILGVQVSDRYGFGPTVVLVILAALFSWRVYRSPLRYGWI